MTRHLRFWLEALFWLLCIYASIPFVRPLCEALRQMVLLNVTVFSSTFILAGLFVRSLGNSKRRQPLTWALIVLAVLCYTYGFYVVTIPEERLHFIQYGILAFLVYRALCEDIKTTFHCYLFAFLLTSAFGWLDEGIQAVTPDRFYSLKDIFLNSVSAVLGLFVTFIGRQKYP